MMAKQQPAEVVWARQVELVADPTGQGKWHPTILIRRLGCTWLVVGLTTQERYTDGSPRISLIQPRWAGFRSSGPSYIWSEDPQRMSVLDIGNHIGWAHPAMVDQIVEVVRLNAADRAALRSGVSWSERAELTKKAS
jgi:hypothetical protein